MMRTNYPPIPRTINGEPMPVIWDDQLKTWRVYQGQMGLVGPNGQPISAENRLPVELGEGPLEVQLKGQIVAIGDQVITVSDTAIGLTPPPGAAYAVITVEVADIRFRIRGDTALPTPTEGHIAEVGDDLVLSSPQDMENFRAVVRDGIDATLFVTYSEVVV